MEYLKKFNLLSEFERFTACIEQKKIRWNRLEVMKLHLFELMEQTIRIKVQVRTRINEILLYYERQD